MSKILRLRRIEQARVENDSRREHEHHVERREEQVKHEADRLRVVAGARRTDVLDDEFESFVEQHEQPEPEEQAQANHQHASAVARS